MNTGSRSASATKNRSTLERSLSRRRHQGSLPAPAGRDPHVFTSCARFTTKKIVLIILDGVGCGELPDASLYGDTGSNTLVNTARVTGGLRLPTLTRLGLGNIVPIQGVQATPRPAANFGRMAERSKGKDSTTGHWEIAGLIVEKAFPTFPSGFPGVLMERFLSGTGCRGFLGNRTASGTAIIRDLGDDHLKTGFPIVYTSADSVFQIAAHEEVIPLARLYDICAKTRTEVCTGEFGVGRVIARPFIGPSGQFTRTTNRKDFSLPPSGTTLLDILHEAGVGTTSIGKVDDLFDGRGLEDMHHSKTNEEGIAEIMRAASGVRGGLFFANLGDFDTLYGHRNDPRGFAGALERFDAGLPGILATIREGDLLVITADHGNDPASSSTDHSREYVPLLCYAPGGASGVHLGTRETFADVGKTVAEFFGVPNTLAGTSFLSAVRAA
jgi:phosphopentomutase